MLVRHRDKAFYTSSGHLEEMQIFLSILIFFGLGALHYEANVASVAVNVALQGLALQSSTVLGQGEANLAIDGNSNPNYLQGSCSQTTSEYQPWWTVDLRRGYLIANVTITSQMNSGSTQVPWAEIHVGESTEGYGVYNPSCSTISSMAAGATMSFPCGGIIGRYVTVVIPNRIDTLTLCEVQVGVLNIPDRQLGVMVQTVSNSGSDLLHNTEIVMQQLRQKIKSTVRTLGWGTDNVLQRDNQTCIPMMKT
ncbi:fucolectin-like [Mixophyes fleayi]|uniref:fucolectin-like n=1 Tax=Mixophyes fleayi TaxID=3061075 RepID=UPI003F4DC87F